MRSIGRFLFGLGVIDLAFIFFTFAIARAGFVFNIPISPFHLVLALILTAFFGIFLSLFYFRQSGPPWIKVAVAWLIIFTILLLSSWAVADHFYDVSFDGQWYHQGTIHLLVNGFDPVYQQAPENYPGASFIDHYPDAFETSSAVIDAFTRHIEDGKMMNILLMVASFLVVFPVVLYVFPSIGRAYALAIALLSALNPVWVYQSLSYYVDGASASLLAMLTFLLLLAYKKMGRALFLIITGVIVLTVNVKAFNLVYVVILIAGFIAICHFNRRATGLHYLLVLSLLVGLLFGADPYITNLVDHGTPFYPVNGISTDMITGDTPPNLVGKNSLEQLFISVFSRSDFEKSDAVLKIPFTVSDKEIKKFYTTDLRVGGFGPLFSGICLLAILLLALSFAVTRQDKGPNDDIILPMCLLLFITVAINPASWWARYVPQLWLIPLLLLLYAQLRFTNKLKILNYAIILIMILNVGMIAWINYQYQLDITHKINVQIDEIRSLTQNRPAQLYCGIFIAAQDRYRERGINFILTDTPPDRQWSTLAEGVAAYGYVTFY